FSGQYELKMARDGTVGLYETDGKVKTLIMQSCKNSLLIEGAVYGGRYHEIWVPEQDMIEYLNNLPRQPFYTTIHYANELVFQFCKRGPNNNDVTVLDRINLSYSNCHMSDDYDESRD